MERRGEQQGGVEGDEQGKRVMGRRLHLMFSPKYFRRRTW